MISCPFCDSTNLKKKGFKREKQLWKCKDCDRKTVRPNEVEEQTFDTLSINNDEFDWLQKDNHAELAVKTKQIKTLDELVKHCNIDLNVWKIDSHIINKWDSTFQGNPIPLFQVKVYLSKVVPDVELIPTIKPVSFNISKIKHQYKEHKQFKNALIIPDSQVGFLRNLKTNKLNPFHDRRCFDIAFQVCKRLKPDTIVLLGDMIDLPEQSDKFLKSPEFYFTTQPSIIELGWFIHQLRILNPDSRIVYLYGNHEDRLRKAIINNFLHSYDLKSYNNLESSGVLSLENLLSLNNIGVECIPDYPSGEYWLNDNLKAIHGNIARNGSGDTVKAVLQQTRSSVIQGHIHRIESASKTVHVKDREIPYTVHSFGCFCKIDGTVPSNSSKENWQNGFGVVEYEEGNGRFQIKPYSITNGETIFDGELIVADEENYLKQLRKDTKWEF